MDTTKWVLGFLIAVVVIGCDHRSTQNYLFDAGAEADVEAKCFDVALLVDDARADGRLAGVTYGKGICYNNSIALDGEKSFFAEAVIVKLVKDDKMFASYIYKTAGDFKVKDENGREIAIGKLSTLNGEVEIGLASHIKTRVAWENLQSGSQGRVLILEIN